MDSSVKEKQLLKEKQPGPVKSVQGKRRFQLFDPTCKSELAKIFKGGLVQLVWESEPEKRTGSVRDSEEDGKDNSMSLNLEGGSDDDDENQVEDLPRDDPQQISGDAVNENASLKRGLFCGSCGVTFADVPEQRQHYTLDWHRYNVKRKLHGQKGPIVEEEFNEMIDDLSSIDGSDDEDEERPDKQQINRLMEKLAGNTSSQASSKGQINLSNKQKLEKSPKYHFQTGNGRIVTCYKVILLESGNEQQEDQKNEVARAPLYRDLAGVIDRPLKITIIMVSGGHFAAAVFDGNSCTHHKTFHSYTVRAKQGGSQGSRDSKSVTSHPKSAGASLRRYNEQSFSQVGTSKIWWIHGGKNPPLNKDSSNLRTIPFPTKRPTFNEVKRVHSLLTTVHIYESPESFQSEHSYTRKSRKTATSDTTTIQSKPKKPIDRAKSRSPKRKDDKFDNKSNSDGSCNDENENTELELVDTVVDFSDLKEYDDSLYTDQKKNRSRKKNKKPKSKTDSAIELEAPLVDLRDLVSKGDLDAVKVVLSKITENTDLVDINKAISIDGLTLLHTAAKQNSVDIVWLLLEAGCDPAIRDKSGKYPYNYADSRECRDIFRRFMGQFPDKYDYKKAQVPPPLSEEMEKERAEKKKLQNKLKREKEKQKKAERFEKDKETEEQRRFLNLSDREKRALAAEQRILAQCQRNSVKAPVLVRCFECAVDITGKVPFEYNQNVFCAPKCLAAHRKKFPSPLSV